MIDNVKDAIAAVEVLGIPKRLKALEDRTTPLSGRGGGISESDADNRYVNVTGDTMTGNLIMDNASLVTGSIFGATGTSTANNGQNVNISGGDGFGESTGSSGGTLTFQGGNAAGTGDNNGGDLIFAPGSGTGAGSRGLLKFEGVSAYGIHDFDDLTDDRTFTWPDKDGTVAMLDDVSGGSPGGSDTELQFNDGGSFGGDAGLTYNKTTDRLTVNGGTVAGSTSIATNVVPLIINAQSTHNTHLLAAGRNGSPLYFRLDKDGNIVTIGGQNARILASSAKPYFPDGFAVSTVASATDGGAFFLLNVNQTYPFVFHSGADTRKSLVARGFSSTHSANVFEVDDQSYNIIFGVSYSNIVLNEQGSNLDIRMEGDTDTNLFVSDASTDSIAIGVAAGSHTGKFHIDQASTTGAKPVLTVDQADVSEEFIRFIGTSTTDASQSLVDAADMATPGSIVGWLKIYVQDDQGTNPITDGAYYVPFYTAPTA